MSSQGEPRLERVGLGSYRLGAPPGASTAPRPVFRSEDLQGPIPAGRWWSSLAWEPFSQPMYPHPLAVQASARGLEVDTPSVSVGIDEQFTSRSILGQFRGDLVITSDNVSFSAALVDAHSDWSVTARFVSAAGELRTTIAHGSPFIYARFDGIEPMLEVTSELSQLRLGEDSIVAFVVNGHPYAAFLPSGSRWELDAMRLRPRHADVAFISLAALPDSRPETVELFAAVAHNHVVSTRVSWRYDVTRSVVHADYVVDLEAREETADGSTLMTLYPHHWRALDEAVLDELTDLSYTTVRGEMKVLAADRFSTTVPFPGALPHMPVLGNETKHLRALIDQIAAEGEHHLTSLIPQAANDMYWTGVSLGRITAIVPIAERVGALELQSELVGWLKKTMESRFQATINATATDEQAFLWWDDDWSTLIGYPGGFGADAELNDHHYQYAYWIRAAVEIARHDRSWVAPERWGGMVDLLVADIATHRRDDPSFPFIRNFDLYAGHSWATGIQQYPDGANSESSSEAIAAWAAVLLWAELRGDLDLRDFAAFLYATEISAAEEYWFDVHRENFLPSFDRAMAGQVWGGKTSYSVWWTDDPEPMRGISFLPLTPTSLYLGRRPEYVRANIADLRRLRPEWSYWPDILWCYEALVDPARALALLEASGPDYTEGHSESKAHTLSWILDLLQLGTVRADVTADAPCYAVFQSQSTRTYLAFNAAGTSRDIHFSDGAAMTVPAGEASLLQRPL